MFIGELGRYFEESWDRYQQARKTREVYQRLGKIHKKLPVVPSIQLPSRGVSYIGVNWEEFPRSLRRFTEDGLVFLSVGSRCTVVSTQEDSRRTLQLIMYFSEHEREDSRSSLSIVSCPQRIDIFNNKQKLSVIDGYLTWKKRPNDPEENKRSVLKIGTEIVKVTQSLIEGRIRGAQRYHATQWD